MAGKFRDENGELKPNRRKNSNGYKYTKIAISILVAAIGWLFLINSRADNKIEKVQSGYTEIIEEISAIKTNIEWIKDYLQEMRRK